MSKIELLEALPLRAALQKIADLELAQRDTTARQAFAEARAILESAIDAGANPQFAEGMDTETYAMLERITPDGARKRARKLAEQGRAEKVAGEWRIYDERQSA